MAFKIDLGKFLPAIIMVSITTYVLSVGSGYLFQAVLADSSYQESEIQVSNNLVSDDSKVISGIVTKSILAPDILTGMFDWSSALVRSNYVHSETTEHENIIRVQLTLDRTAPYVVSVNPPNRASNVLPSATISATFSEQVRPETLTTSTFTLTDSDGQRVVGSVGPVRDHRTQPTSYGAYFRPSSPLEGGEIYTATLTSGIKDMANLNVPIFNKGNALTPRTWSFMVTSSGSAAPPGQTGADRTPPTVLAVTPMDGANNVPPNAIIAARFSEPVIRSSVSTSSFQVKDNSGLTVPGVVVRPGSTLSAGITTASFDSPSAYEIGETYTVTITGNVRDIANNPLNPPHTWSFTVGDTTTPATGADSNAPTVLSVIPGDGTSGVPLYSSIRAMFSEPVRKSTVSTSTFMLKDSSGNAVPGTILLPTGASINQAGLDPSSSLVVGQRYTAEITNGVKDITGNSLTPKKWSFTVGSSAGQAAGAARVLSTQPGDRTEDVPRNTHITAKLSKLIDPSTLSTSTFMVKDRAGNTVVGSVFAQQSGTNTFAVFDPSSQLRSDTRHNVEITNAVKDTEGQPIIPKRWSFTTR
jgi:Bacterial Ig-like domain